MRVFTATEIENNAKTNGLTVETVIKSNGFDVEKMQDIELEYLSVNLGGFKTAFFLMNDDFDYNFSHVYNANNDKTTKRLPKKLS